MPDSTASKTCRDCGDTKPLDLFHRENRSADGRRVNCKACRIAYQQGVYVENRGEILAQAATRYRENLDANRDYQRRYHESNRDAKNAAGREWRAANPERVAELNRDYYAVNKEAIAEKSQTWREANRNVVYALNHKRRALKRSAFVDPGIHVESLRAIHGDSCAYCHERMTFDQTGLGDPLKATVEHVIPLSRGGLHSFENTKLACSRCNSSKRDKLVSEWSPLAATRSHGAKALHQAT